MDGIVNVHSLPNVDHLHDENGLQPSHVSHQFNYNVEVDGTFPDFESIKQLVRQNAYAEGWQPNITRSNRKALVIDCRSSTDCTYHLRAILRDNVCTITVFVAVHTCDGQEAPIRPMASYVSFLKEKLPQVMIITTLTATRDIQKVVERHFDTKIQLQQAQRLKRFFTVEQPQQQQQALDFNFPFADTEADQDPQDTTLDATLDAQDTLPPQETPEPAADFNQTEWERTLQ